MRFPRRITIAPSSNVLLMSDIIPQDEEHVMYLTKELRNEVLDYHLEESEWNVNIVRVEAK